ncbi:NACHT domain-containing protein [Streptomyces sp. ActVer]|uniref:NACHT domain-containing protein n=1 Tax=Streptomyces sp. ActVer TaxID=3014558 RepID=UPI0022B2B429|nr:NACHT domain-containing protein [Streptomyces sp. ActVer]MCZ4510025.1 NACHT domain-containing protein [Streptomyces sp. ActVer]
MRHTLSMSPSQHAKAPARLHTLASAQTVPLPVHTSEQLLPLEHLAWENFERLCLKRAVERGTVEDSADHAGGDSVTGRLSAYDAQAQGSLYGTRGQEQQGIDLYVRLPGASAQNGSDPERVYLSLQSRRVKSLTARQLKEAVTDFLDGTWAAVSRVFVYATSLSAVPQKTADEVVTQRKRLARAGITFEVWDAEYLSAWLKQRPQVVHDFFGRAWVEELFGPEQVTALATRLDAVQVADLRAQLGSFYATFFAHTDSGAIALQHAPARPDLRQRFVLPDVLPVHQLGRWPAQLSPPDAVSPGMSPTAWYRKARASAYGHHPGELGKALTVPASEVGEQMVAVSAASPAVTGEATGIRTSADAWLAGARRHVLVGEAGSGKSSLLRFALLDLFADSPALPRWTERFGDRLPLWVPFPFFTRRLARYDGAEASLAATLRAWLEQYDVGHLWPLVEKALADDRLLLVIDGLDEWVSESAARRALTALETFLDQRQLPAVAATRPYGLSRLQPTGVWQYASLAPLSSRQQRELVAHWLGTAGVGGDTQAEAFVKELSGVRDLRQLARIPLFLLLLTGMRLAGAALPTRRFEVYAGAVDHLLGEHPARRGTAAGITAEPTALHPDDIRQVLAHVALAHQQRGDVQAVPEQTVRADIIDALRDPRHLALDAAGAAAQARGFVDIAEGQLGVLVRQGPREIGFLHRVLLEQLAAEQAAQQLSFDELRRLFAQRAQDPRWHEVLLAILWQLQRTEETSRLLQELAEKADGPEPEALAVRELVAQAVFGGIRLPLPQARRHAATILEAVDSHPLVGHRQRLLSACVAGLDDPAVSGDLVSCLSRWVVAGQPLPWQVFHRLGQVADDRQLAEPVWPLLVAALRSEDVHVAWAAARALAARYGTRDGQEHVVEAMLTTLRHAASADHAAVILHGLLLGWPDEDRVTAAAAAARRQQVLGLRLTALAAVLGVLPGRDTTGRMARGSQPQAMTAEERAWLVSRLDTEDFTDNVWKPVLTDAIAAALREAPGEAEQVRDTCLSIVSGRRPGQGDRAAAWSVLLLAYAQDAAVIDYVCTTLVNDPHQIRFLGIGPLARAYPRHTAVAAAAEELLQQDPRAFLDFELPSLVTLDQGPVLRSVLLKELHDSEVPHWAADALAEHWAHDTEVQQALCAVLNGEAGRASRVANAAVRVLGAEQARERLLALLATPAPTQDSRFRKEIVIHALLESCQNQSLTSGPVAEQIARVCLEAVQEPANEYEFTAEAAVIVVLPATASARDRAASMLRRPQAPLGSLLAGYGSEPSALEPVLDRVRAAHPALPTAARLHLCTLLRDHPGDSTLIRQLTAQWPNEPHDLVRSAASAVFHTHLLHDHDRGALPEPEWQKAQSVLRDTATGLGYNNWAQRRAAWLGILLTDQLGLLDDLVEQDGRPIRLPLGEFISTDLDLLVLGEIADHWPALRAHFGDTLLKRLTGDMLSRAMDTAWEYLALVADRHPQLAQELAAAVDQQPDLLTHDTVLAWYAHTHRGEPHLLHALIDILRPSDNGSRDVAPLLLADPLVLGLDPATVQRALHTELSPRRCGYPLPSSGAFLALVAGFPDDTAVADAWEALQHERDLYGQVEVDVSVYYPLAYAAVETADFVDQVSRDSAWISSHFTNDVDPPFAQAVIRRLERDPEARTRADAAIISTDTSDARAAQLASLSSAATALPPDVADNLRQRLHRQQGLQLPDAVHDFVTATDVPVPALLLRILQSGTGR